MIKQVSILWPFIHKLSSSPTSEIPFYGWIMNLHYQSIALTPQ
jgi:hypothetical protein